MRDLLRRLDLPNLPVQALHDALRLLIALLLFLVGLWLAARVANIARRALQRARVEPTLINFLRNREAVIPNAKVGADTIVNYNRRGTRRAQVQVASATATTSAARCRCCATRWSPTRACSPSRRPRSLSPDWATARST